jgi:hypothetical protein
MNLQYIALKLSVLACLVVQTAHSSRPEKLSEREDREQAIRERVQEEGLQTIPIDARQATQDRLDQEEVAQRHLDTSVNYSTIVSRNKYDKALDALHITEALFPKTTSIDEYYQHCPTLNVRLIEWHPKLYLHPCWLHSKRLVLYL